VIIVLVLTKKQICLHESLGNALVAWQFRWSYATVQVRLHFSSWSTRTFQLLIWEKCGQFRYAFTAVQLYTLISSSIYWGQFNTLFLLNILDFLFKSDLILPPRAGQVRFCGSSRACYKKFKNILRAVQYSVFCGAEIHCTNLNVSSFDHLNR
jgi:hypothetical protein